MGDRFDRIYRTEVLKLGLPNPVDMPEILTRVNESDICLICELLIEGLPLTDCCKFVGLQLHEMRRWQEEIRKNYDKYRDSKYEQWYLKLARSGVDGKRGLIQLIKNHAKKDWKAAAYLLERMDANKTVLGGSNRIGGKDSLSLEDKKNLLQLIKDSENGTDETGLSVYAPSSGTNQ